MDSCIRKLMLLPVSWQKYLQQTGAGEKVYDTPVTLYGYKRDGYSMYRTPAGEERISREVIYFEGAATGVLDINVNDTITVPGGKKYYVMFIRPYYDDKGNIDIVEVLI